MAKRPLRKNEDIAAVPLDQPVDLDLAADDPVVTIEPDVRGEPKKPPVQEPVPVEEDVEKLALKKQVDDLRSAEIARKADFDRQLQEASRRNQELEQQNFQQASSELEAQYDSVLNSIEAAETAANAAIQAYEQAASLGDYKAQAEAQRKLSRAEASLVNLESGKAALEARRDSFRAHAEQRRQNPPVTDQFEASIMQLPDAAKTWLRGHREYMTEPRKYAQISHAHFQVLDEGVAMYSPQYFESLEKKLGLRQNPEGQDDPPTNREGPPVSAPVSRDPPSPATGVATPTRITLTAEQREAARASMPDVPPGEAEKIYAQQLLKLNGLKKQGFYRES